MGEHEMWPTPIIHLLSNHISDMETGFVVNVCTSYHHCIPHIVLCSQVDSCENRGWMLHTGLFVIDDLSPPLFLSLSPLYLSSPSISLPISFFTPLPLPLDDRIIVFNGINWPSHSWNSRRAQTRMCQWKVGFHVFLSTLWQVHDFSCNIRQWWSQVTA